MDHSLSLQIAADQPLHPVSPMLFGIFLEDINFSCDGGLNANLVNNSSFDGVYLSKKGYNSLISFLLKPDPQPVVDRLRYWTLSGGQLASRHDDPVTENSWYARVQVEGQARLENLGFNGGKRHVQACAMSIQAGQDYAFAAYARSRGYSGSITVSVTDASGTALTTLGQFAPTDGWQHFNLAISGKQTCYGKLVLSFDGHGAVDLDGISLMTTDTWGQGNPKWSQGKLRRDLVEALRDLKPRFLRFPGGCIVEGNGPGNEYNWKDTVGPLINRKGKYNLWGAGVPDGGYYQSYHMGFYEYFLLCEDLGMEPLPTIFAGLNCQYRSHHHLETSSPEFQEQVVQSALDLIEYANGDPNTNPWAALRAAAGHPEPFGLKYIGIGNENHGEDYLEKFDVVKRAIDAHYPGMTCVLSGGAFPQGKGIEASWAKAYADYPDVRVDEHCYNRPAWFIQGYHRYDNYPRDGAKVYMGEYAANMPISLPFVSIKPNAFQTALAEAAFLAGLERNSDVVAMSSYAPLFSLSEGEQWAQNLINFNPAHVLLTTNYFVQKLYSTTVGDTVVDVQGELSAKVFTSATTTERQLIVKLINLEVSAVQVYLQLAGVTNGSARMEYMQCDDLNAVNSLTFNSAPQYRVTPQSAEFNISDGRAVVDLKPNSFYVLQINR